MRPRPRGLLPAVAGAVLAALAPAARADLAPFGHACTPTLGMRFCPTPDLASRPASFDGTPIDVDVTLPAEGDGPFPAVLLLHALGEDKTSMQNAGAQLAQRGYAAVTPTVRGFAGSCGPPSAATPGCERGFTRFGDMRYEVRDLQTLVGRLVDEGVVRPDAIGATGISYGGALASMLAFLKDRVRLPGGGFAPWTSPGGTPISLAAAWSRWSWTDGEAIFSRNGRAPWSRAPAGVEARAYADAIFSVVLEGAVAPLGSGPSADIGRWRRLLDAGTFGAATRRFFDVAHRYRGVAGLPRAAGGPAPLLLQSGWTDALVPVGQALGAYDAIRRADPRAPVALQVSDAGHAPGANHPGDLAAFAAQGATFLDAWLLRSGAGAPAPGSVTAYTMSCPASARFGGGPFTARSFRGLARGTLRMASDRPLAITSAGASRDMAAKVTATAPNGALCVPQVPDRGSTATVSAPSPGVTLIGRPVLTGRVAASGRSGQLDVRLWDLSPRTRRQRLITRGAYRLTDGQHGRFRFTLDGNGWRFARGHRIVVELLGRDAPTYAPSPHAFRARLTAVRVALPVRDRTKVP